MRTSLIDRLRQLHGTLLDVEEQIKEIRDDLPSGATDILLDATAIDVRNRRRDVLNEIVVLGKGDV